MSKFKPLKMEIVNLNAIPIAHDKNVYLVNAKELNAIKRTKYRTPNDGFYLSQSVFLLKNKALSSLKKFIINKAKEYTREVLEIKDDIYLTQSWSTINTTNSSHKLHAHLNTFISIVYYAQCRGGHTYFDLNASPIREGFNFQYTVTKGNIYNSQTWKFPVRTGDIMLFPGHIRHGSTPNRSQQNRIIVGANFFIKGKLGSEKDVSLITI